MNLEMPTATLSTGLTVGNFSSPHAFSFDDGVTLAACNPARTRRLCLEPLEDSRLVYSDDGTSPLYEDIRLGFLLDFRSKEELERIHRLELVQIVIVPLPLLQLVRDKDYGARCRTVRMADRVNKVARHDAFCR